MPLEATIVSDASLAFPGRRLAECSSRSLAGDEAGPAIVNPMEPGRLVFASAVGLATGAGGRGDAAWEQGNRNFKNPYFVLLRLHSICPDVYIH